MNPDTLSTNKPASVVVLAFCCGDQYGIGDDPMLLAEIRETKNDDIYVSKRELAFFETDIEDNETPAEAALRCANSRIWRFGGSEDCLRPQDIVAIGMNEWPDLRQMIFRIRFMVERRFIKSPERVERIPMDYLWLHWNALIPQSQSVLLGLPHLEILYDHTQPFYGGVNPSLMRRHPDA
jgi:hypothetical protein